jgi:hypothetical protein
MSLNRREIEKRLSGITSNLLREKGYISFVDVFISMEKLSKEDYENWRFKKVPYLERVIKVNLAKINLLFYLANYRITAFFMHLKKVQKFSQ